ncbi:hypothetical protein DAEQUDRAFT_769964 [Daedalea quercina L-15889]|uniref:Condensation domain-containing protein n=1 Tax=Daedalea quercina L-15889 TaxID=1314783 RepID=A0A165L9R3_9APHY|nr:hypothetical protein DAEQUDRAFT_769964 [Daedalea quercina L-15889]
MTVGTPKSTPNPAIQALLARVPEAGLTTSRPLSMGEFIYVATRQGGGMADPSTIVPLECSGGHVITDDEVVAACAVLRLRYPLLASNVTLFNAPHFVVNMPLTPAHALRMAKDQIEFHTFEDQEQAVVALRDEWLAFDPDKALDIRERTCALWWGRDADQKSGKYVFGLITTHFVTDNRRRLNLVRRFLELLAKPGQAQAELGAHFASKAPPAPIPMSTEQLKPELNMDDEELRNAQAAFDQLPMSGISADVPGSASASAVPIPRILRKVWSTEDTTRILRACKAHGVTITHLVNVASAMSSVYDSVPSNAAPENPDDDAFYFETSQAIDLTAKVPKPMNGPADGDMEAAVRIELYPVIFRVPRTAITNTSSSAHVWEISKQFKARNDAFVQSPYFWHFLPMHFRRVTEGYNAKLAGLPALPFMSSLGDLKSVLPARYPVWTAGAAANGDAEAEIRVTDNWTAGRIDPFSLVYHLFTFDGRLHLQFRYNVNRTSDALIKPWFDRVVDTVSRSAQDP